VDAAPAARAGACTACGGEGCTGLWPGRGAPPAAEKGAQAFGLREVNPSGDEVNPSGMRWPGFARARARGRAFGAIPPLAVHVIAAGVHPFGEAGHPSRRRRSRNPGAAGCTCPAAGGPRPQAVHPHLSRSCSLRLRTALLARVCLILSVCSLMTPATCAAHADEAASRRRLRHSAMATMGIPSNTASERQSVRSGHACAKSVPWL